MDRLLVSFLALAVVLMALFYGVVSGFPPEGIPASCVTDRGQEMPVNGRVEYFAGQRFLCAEY